MKYAIIFATLLLNGNVAINAMEKKEDTSPNQQISEDLFFLLTMAESMLPDFVSEDIEKHRETIADIEKTATEFSSKIEKKHKQLKQQYKQMANNNAEKLFNLEKSGTELKTNDELFKSLIHSFTKKILLTEKVTMIKSAKKNIEECKVALLAETQKHCIKRDHEVLLENVKAIKLYDDLLPMIKEDLEEVMSIDFLPKPTK